MSNDEARREDLEKEELERKRRLPRMRRVAAEHLPPFRLTKRDYRIVEAVYTHRALTAPQIEALLFPPTPGKPYSKKTACQRRLKLLFQHGYLARDEQPSKSYEPSKPFIYLLDEEGARLISERQDLLPEEIDWRPSYNSLSPITLAHFIALNDVRVAIEVAAAEQRCEITRWLDEKSLKSAEWSEKVEFKTATGKTDRAYIYPDGYFCLNDGKYNYHHFLEVDMATETIKSARFRKRDFARKIRAYRAFYESGKYEQKYGTQVLRVLTITKGSSRMTNLKEAAEEISQDEMFWFTTFEQLNSRTALYEPIWEAAGGNGTEPLIWHDE